MTKAYQSSIWNRQFAKRETSDSAVILINYTDGITYGDFIVILDMCVADDPKRNAPWDKKFVTFGNPPNITLEYESRLLHRFH
jgi:hypothetical protein